MKPVKGWVIIKTGRFEETLWWTFNEYARKSSVSNFLKFKNAKKIIDWKHYYKQGYRCIRATLRADE